MVTANYRVVKACYGCKLNGGTRCAVFENPKHKWQHGHCAGYNNPELLEHYARPLHPEGAKLRHMLRAEKARLAHTVAHRDGFHRLG